ncbi:type B 50S ribosomal protein L31 [Candidatus Kaiserbacteria bacterium]|nr:type B 50S ribosomal protein L31 [Candidatus Kaiserbacteria bacterium]
MKKDIHPDTYREVIFEDLASGARFPIGSTVTTTETAKGEDGKMYPKFTVEISSKSHPFYTGEDRSLDTTGRVERFKQRAAKKSARSGSASGGK